MIKMNKNYEGLLVDRNLEIFELEEKIKKIEIENKELKKYQGMYFQKLKEVDKMKRVIKENITLLPDQVKYNFQNLLEELSGIKYN